MCGVCVVCCVWLLCVWVVVFVVGVGWVMVGGVGWFVFVWVFSPTVVLFGIVI